MTERMIGAAVLAVLWLGFTGYNVLFAVDRVRRRAHDGPSPLPLFGSLFGIVALLLVPAGTQKLVFLPLALIPDLAMPVSGKIVDRLGSAHKNGRST